MAKSESRRLGKGLGALLSEYLDEEEAPRGPIREIDVARVRPNPFQPRREFAEEALGELEESIRANGLLQPLVVRAAGEGWELVAGERRLRALQRLGWERAPAIVRELGDPQMLVLALVENLQRESLGPLEEARGYQQLVDGFGLTQKQVAERVGRDRSTVANALRLLALPDGVQELLEAGRITAGHARAVLMAEGAARQEELAREVVQRSLSVRETERRARRPARKPDAGGRRGEGGDPVARKAETLFSRSLGTRVVVRLSGSARGEIRVPFHDAEDFERVARRLLEPAEAAELFEDA